MVFNNLPMRVVILWLAGTKAGMVSIATHGGHEPYAFFKYKKLVRTRHKTVTGFIVHDVCSSVMHVKSTISVTSSSKGRRQVVLDEKIGMWGRQKVVLDGKIGL